MRDDPCVATPRAAARAGRGASSAVLVGAWCVPGLALRNSEFQSLPCDVAADTMAPLRIRACTVAIPDRPAPEAATKRLLTARRGSSPRTFPGSATGCTRMRMSGSAARRPPVAVARDAGQRAFRAFLIQPSRPARRLRNRSRRSNNLSRLPAKRPAAASCRSVEERLGQRHQQRHRGRNEDARQPLHHRIPLPLDE